MIGRKFKRLRAVGQGDGLRAQLLRGGMGVGMLKLLSLPLTLLATILLARGLGPEGFGQYAFITALLTTLSIPLGPALMQLVTRETAKLHHDGEADRITLLLRWANRHVLLGSALVATVIGTLALWQAQWRVDDRWTLLLVGLLALPLLGLNAVRSGILAGLRRVVMGQFPDLLVRPLVLVAVVGVLLLFGSLNPATAVAAFIGGAGMAFLFGVILLRRVFQHEEQASRKPRYTGEESRKWMRAWVPFTLLVATSTLDSQIGILFLGWLSTDEQVAAMHIAQRGSMLVALSLSVVDAVINPHITRIYQQGDKAKLQLLAQRSAQAVLLISLPVALPLIFFGSPIFSFVMGEEYSDLVGGPVAILAIGQLINMAFGSVGMLLVMSGHEKETIRGLVLALGVNTLMAVVLVPSIGAVGAAFSSSVGMALCNIFLLFRVREKIGIIPTAASFERIFRR